MTDAVPLPPLLLGLFRHLVDNGVSVGVRDYLDGLRALELGFGGPDRVALRDLAQMLWARSDVERRLIARWFDRIPFPDAASVTSIDKGLADLEPSDSSPIPQDSALEADQAAAPVEETSPAATGGKVPTSVGSASARARVSFTSTREDGGLPVPRLAVELSIGEHYVLHPLPLVSQRELAVLWRRYRRGTRRGPRTELDVPASIRERCRRGLLKEPVCRARRSNSARLLVLADTSPSMDPWRLFLSTLAESLPLGRLANFEVRYFANLPHKQLFETPELTHAGRLEEILRRHAGAGLLVVSDAGSARGYLNRRRFVQTTRFLDLTRRHFSTLVWFNPMPRSRWTNTTASLLAAAPGVTMLPLDSQHLLRGIDILRGKK